MHKKKNDLHRSVGTNSRKVEKDTYEEEKVNLHLEDRRRNGRLKCKAVDSRAHGKRQEKDRSGKNKGGGLFTGKRGIKFIVGKRLAVGKIVAVEGIERNMKKKISSKGWRKKEIAKDWGGKCLSLLRRPGRKSLCGVAE